MNNRPQSSLAGKIPGRFAWEEKFEINRREGVHLPAMEGLRGFSILVVFLAHYVIHSIPLLPEDSFTLSFAKAFFNNAHTAVDLFFLLSGFFIYGALISRPRSPWKFYARRAERIYPPFLTMFLIYLVLSWIFPAESKLPTDSMKALGYLLANLLFLPGLFPIQPLISVTWTMSYEVFFYLSIPLLILALRLYSWREKSRCIFHLALTTLTAIVFYHWGGHVRLIMFISGMLLHDFLRVRTGFNILPGVGLVTLAIAFSLMLFIPFGATGLVMRAVALFCLLPFTALDCVQNPHGATARFFSWTPLRWLGNMSYSYYLMHGLVIKGLFYVYPLIFTPQNLSVETFWIGILPAFLATLAASLPLYLFIEHPFSLMPKRLRVHSDQPVHG